MAGALPFLQVGAAGYGLFSQMAQDARLRKQQDALAEQMKPMSWDAAMNQATTNLSPVYDQQLRNTMQQSDKDLIARGLYGQLPGDALGQSRRWDVLNDKQTAINNLATSLSSQGQQNALQLQQMAMQQALGQGQQRWQMPQFMFDNGAGLWQQFKNIESKMGLAGTTVDTSSKGMSLNPVPYRIGEGYTRTY